MTYPFLGKTLSGRFTIPSGIVTTAPSIMQYFLNEVPQIGVLTTKSIGLEPRLGNREPVYSQYAPGCFVNAVGLTNPGAIASATLLSELSVPDNRFLLTSIFGGSIEEFVAVAQIVAPFSDGLELNLSCPHAEGYGMAMGQDPDLVYEIVSAVKAAVSIPVIPKLTPNTDDIASIAMAAQRAGADGLCAINTVGPGHSTSFGHPVLSNGSGGLSGKGILAIALKCISETRQACDLPIIGCGGVSSAGDVAAMLNAGADIVGIGSALTDMTTNQVKAYFNDLELDQTDHMDRAEQRIQYQLDMGFRPVSLIKNEAVCNDIALLTFAEDISVKPGEFFFVWIPGVGEKPFSALTDAPFRLVAIDVGSFTHQLMALEPGSEIYIRGPHGKAASIPENAHIMAVAGGTGLAAVYQIARDADNAEIFAGARTAERLYFIDECKNIATVHIATDDGSRGYSGTVTELLRTRLRSMNKAEHSKIIFYNCGPEPMVHAAMKVQREFCSDEQIFSSIDYLTKCGVGICGACATPDGQRLCVDGPFLPPGQAVLSVP